MDIRWVKIKSWHALRPDPYFGPSVYCGSPHLKEGAETSEDLPTGGKKCDSCEEAVLKILEAKEIIG